MSGTGPRSLLRDSRGVSTLEFALVLPAVLMTMMGLTEIGYQEYVQSILFGAVQKAGRDSAIQGNGDTKTTTALDNTVKTMVNKIVWTATYNSSRTNYDTYASIAGEPFTDSKYPANSSGVYDGKCDHGEPYVDVNSNGRYDLDLSTAGQGGASDITKYAMSVTYRRLFPISWFGWSSNNVTLTASTILKNQPYGTQSTNSGTTIGYCP